MTTRDEEPTLLEAFEAALAASEAPKEEERVEEHPILWLCEQKARERRSRAS